MINFHKIRDDLSNVMDVLKPTIKTLDGAMADISLDGENIAVANTQQPSHIAYYDEVKVQLKHLVDFLDLKVKQKRGVLWKEILSTFSKSLTDGALNKLIDADDEYVIIYTTYLDVKELYDRASSIVNAFTQRSYTLTNLVKIFEHQLQDITIHMNDEQ